MIAGVPSRLHLCAGIVAVTIWCAAAVLAAGRADEVQVALPPGEMAELEALLDLLRRSRAEIARVTGAPLRKIRVTVHPTAESFFQATGRSWLVAGATRGSDIHLLPIAMLRGNGQLERIVRHEVTHALIDRLIDGRPLWVREGMAAHFARQPDDRPARLEPSIALRCPADDELNRPSSAQAQRDAYARAEACVVREIASGVRWREVGK